MSKSCLLNTHVRNPQGSMVESRLFNDLLNYLPSRALAVEYYAVGTNQEFLNEVKGKAKYDENGEITFESLRQLSNMNLSEEELIAKLDKEIGAGTMDYQQAIAKVKEFNANSQFNDRFLATATYNNKGQYELHITKKTPGKIAELQKTIEKQELRDKLLSQLRSHGVGVVFTEGNGGGRYSTVNVEQAADGLYNLIQVSHGEHVNSDLAEEAGHFAVAALGHSPLVNRLMNLLNEDVQKEILGDEYGVKDLGANPRRELAGTLVGRALERKLSATTPWQKLANRVADMAKFIFAKFSGDSVRIAREQSQKIARDIANGFLSDNFDGNIANALEYKETLNSATLPYNVRVFKQTVEALGTMAKELEAVEQDKLASTITAYVGTAVAGRDTVVTNPTIDAELISFQGLCQTLTDIVDLLGPGKEIDNLLNSVDFSNPTDFYQRMAEHGRSLRKVRVFVRNAGLIATILREAVDSHDNKLVLPSGQTLSNAYFTNVLGQFQQIDFRKMLGELEDCIKVLDSRLSSKENAYFCRFCEDTYGSKYVNTAAQIIWKEHKLTAEQVQNIPIQDMLEHLEDDIDIFHRYIGSMSNNPDIIGQIVDRAVKAANKLADDRTIQYQDRLRALQQEFEDKYGFKRGHTEVIFEKDSEGNYTGNLVTAPNPEILDDNDNPVAVNYGEWEKAREEFKKQCWENFKALNPNWESWTGFTRGWEWDKYFRPLMKDWDKTNTTIIKVKDSQGNVIKVEKHPSAKYKSTQFDDMVARYPGIQNFLAEIRQIKEELDSLLPDGATHNWRAPQFKGTFMNKVQNKKMLMSRGKAYKKAVRDEILETFCESSEDTDYGDQTTMNSPNDDLMGTPMDYEKEKPNRLPMFGINKLQDMTQLSTDIFHSLLSYASMANSYAALDSVVDAIEVGRAALENRKVIGAKREKDLEKHTRAYTRYLKYLDKQVYGISATNIGRTIRIGYVKNKDGKYIDRDGNVIVGGKKNKDFKNLAVPIERKVLLNKVVQFLTRLGSFMYLGGNVMGGVTNTGTGAIELFKEAITSEYYSPKDWFKAHNYYWKSLASNWRHPGSIQKDDKMSLFIRYFNVKGDNREKFRSRYNRQSRLHRFIDSSIYLPYSSGDHYMQSMSYLAIANGTSLYSNGTTRNLWDCYKRVESSKGKNGKDKTYTLEFDGLLLETAVGPNGVTFDKLDNNKVFLKEESKSGEYNMLKDMLGQIEKAISSPLLGINFSQEQKDYLASHNIGLGDLHKIRTQVQNDIYKMIWTKDDEIKFMDKAREVNNRMHGIYNNQDKTAWHQNWFANAFLAMKGYALGLMERRFSYNHKSIALDNDVEGSLNTMSKLWLSTFSKEINTRFKDALCATFFTPFMSKEVKQRLKDAGFSDGQMANIRRNFMDYIVLSLLYILRMLCAEPPKEEKDDEYEPDQLAGLSYYFVSRWIREQEAFNAPWGIANESMTLTDAIPVGGHAFWELCTLSFYEIPGGTFGDIENSNFYYQRDHPEGKYYEGDPKYWNHLGRLVPYYKSIYNLNHPYEALESYEFGRKLGGR